MQNNNMPADYLAEYPADPTGMSRLADRLSTMVPPSVAATLASAGTPSIPRPSPAVASGIAAASQIAERAARRAERNPRSITGMVVGGFVAACSFIPYALVALALRLVMAREFFLSGQSKIDGPRVPLHVQDFLQGFDLSVVLPLQVKAETISLFMTKYAAVPVPPVLAAYVVSFAEFILPICLVLGLATRFAAFGLLIMTAVIQYYVLPEALWTTHIYWVAILLVLLTRGPGQISIDHIIRYIARR